MKVYDTLASSILNKLEKEFHKQIIQSSMVILKTPNITTKFSNFATNIRELTKEVFYTLAPYNEVKNCSWYKREIPVVEEDITRFQRMTYAIKGGLSDKFIKYDEFYKEKLLITYESPNLATDILTLRKKLTGNNSLS